MKRLAKTTLLGAFVGFLAATGGTLAAPFDMTPELRPMPPVSPGAATVPVAPPFAGPAAPFEIFPKGALPPDPPPAAPPATVDIAPLPAPARPPFSIEPPRSIEISQPPAIEAPSAAQPTEATSPITRAGAETARIDRFIVPSADLQLEGELDRRSWTVALTAAEASQAATLVVTFSNAILVMPEGSVLRVAINDQPILEQKLDAAEQPRRLSVALPRGNLRAGANLLTFSVVQRHRTDCTIASTYELWTRIVSAGTGFSFGGDGRQALTSLEDLPAVGFDVTGVTRLRFIVPRGVQALADADVLALVQALNLKGRYPHALVSVADSVGAAPDPGTLQVAIGTSADLAAIVADLPGDAASRPTAVFVNSAPSPLLVLSGPAWIDVVAAMQFVVSGVLRPLDVSRTVIETSAWLAPPVPLLTGERTISFADFGIPTEEFSGRRFHTAFYVGLPGDFYAGAYGEATLYLDAAYTDEVKPGSHIDIYVNGFTAANVPLTSKSGALLDHLPIKIPLTHFRPGVNRVTFEAVLATEADAACAPGATFGGPDRFVFFDTSEFNMPDFARMSAWPDLSAFAGAGAPYGRSDAPVELVLGRADADTWSAAATLLARLSTSSGRIVPFSSGASAEAIGERPALFVGAIGQFSSETIASLGIAEEARNAWVQRPSYVGDDASIGLSSPTAIDPTGIAVRNLFDRGEGTNGVFQRWQTELVEPGGIRGYWLSFELWLQRTFDLSFASFSIVRQEEKPYLPPERATLVIGQVPASAGRAWTFVAAPSTSALIEGVATITEEGYWSDLTGRIDGFDAGTGQTYATSPESERFSLTSGFSLPNLRLVAANWLSTNIVSYAFALVLLCAALGICTSALLMRLGRKS